eukprot:s483_g21.t1
MRIHIAQALQIPAASLLDHHVVSDLPSDLASQDLLCVLPQLLSEPRPSAFQCLVLLDVEVYEENDIQPSAFRRYPRWMPTVINWISFFRLLGFEHHCVRREHQCRLWHNNRLVDPAETIPLRLNDGDYTKIFIGDPDCGFQDLAHLGISEDAFDQLGIPADAFDDVSIFQSHSISIPDTTPGPPSSDRPTVCAYSLDRRYLEHGAELPRFAEPSSRRPYAPAQPTSEDWLLPIGMNLIESLTSGMLAEDGMTEWITWYLHSHDRESSEESRPLRLDVEQELWTRDLCLLWRDLFRLGVPYHVYVVEPFPPRADHQVHAGHLLLVQGEHPGHVPVLISTVFESHYGRRLSFLASYLPTFVAFPEITHKLRLSQICRVRDCDIIIDGLSLDPDGLGQLQAGDGILVRVTARHLDGTSLLQMGLGSILHKTYNQTWQTPFSSLPILHWKLDSDDVVHCHVLDGHTTSNEPPQAFIRQHGTDDVPVLRADPLWELWNRPRLRAINAHRQQIMTFETWYLHGTGATTCRRSRFVDLPEEVDTWIDHLRQAWADHVIAQTPLELAIVHPEVWPASNGGHLILLQDVPPDAKGCLLSSYWSSRRGALQDRYAQIVPTILSFPALLHHSELTVLCDHPESIVVLLLGIKSLSPQRSCLFSTVCTLRSSLSMWS